MTNTQKKLDEARYFLNQLRLEDPYFDYVLSAFLNAARSTFWVMRHEFDKVPGWEQWFDAADASEEEQILLSETNQMRIDSAKKGKMNTEFFLFGDDTVSIDEESYPEAKRMLAKLEGKEFELTIAPVGDAERSPSSEDTYVLHAYVKRECERAPDSRPAIKRKCDEYFTFLEKIVCECYKKFDIR
ncbi:MAG: hypothetical protein U0Q18_37110 [Bryobacteraceae bacterium]